MLIRIISLLTPCTIPTLREHPRNGPKLVVGKLISTNVVLREGDGWVWVVDVISEPDLSF